MHNILSYLIKPFVKIGALVQFPAAWLAGLGLFIADAFTRGKLTIYLVVVACIVDLICGIAVAIHRGKFTRSELMRLTVEKLLVYGCVMLVFLCIDGAIAEETGFELSLTSTLVGVVITLTEAWSFLASLLILFPKNALLRMMQKALTAEIAGKLGVEKDEVDAILADSRKRTSKKSTKPKYNEKV